MQLQTERLILRSFCEEDLDSMAQLMADAEFMQYSSGVYDRDQTAAFLDKIIGRERGGLPSPIAARFLADPSGKHSIAPHRRENGDDFREGNHISRISDARVCDNAGAVAGGACR